MVSRASKSFTGAYMPTKPVFDRVSEQHRFFGGCPPPLGNPQTAIKSSRPGRKFQNVKVMGKIVERAAALLKLGPC